MSELAFNKEGEPFALPNEVTAWRVSKMRNKGENGGPVLCYSLVNGKPLTVPVTATLDDLRREVEDAGRYRLDPIDNAGISPDGVQAAYIYVAAPLRRNSAVVGAPEIADSRPESLEHEALRMSLRLAETVVARFSDVIGSTANLLRAADGAGIVARRPVWEPAPELGPAPIVEVPQNPVMAILASLAANPAVIAYLASRAPSIAEMVDWRRAAPGALPAIPAETQSAYAEPMRNAAPTPPPTAAPTNAEQNKIGAVLLALTPEERERAQLIALRLTEEERGAWLAELDSLTIADAIARVRAVISRTGVKS
ncbi:MAG TPA: hypothetical protein VGM88_11685 [Kofleriaceae bacterium]